MYYHVYVMYVLGLHISRILVVVLLSCVCWLIVVDICSCLSATRPPAGRFPTKSRTTTTTRSSPSRASLASASISRSGRRDALNVYYNVLYIYIYIYIYMYKTTGSEAAIGRKEKAKRLAYNAVGERWTTRATHGSGQNMTHQKSLKWHMIGKCNWTSIGKFQ